MRAARFNPQQRRAEKELSRRVDERAMDSGTTSPLQVKDESGSFAFGKDRASINLGSARQLV